MIELGPSTAWDISCVAMDGIRALVLAAGADAGARNDAGHTAAAEDRRFVAEQLAASERRAAEKGRRLATWRALVLEEVARTHGQGIDKVPLHDVMRAVGESGFGWGRVSAPPSSLSDAHRRAITRVLK